MRWLVSIVDWLKRRPLVDFSAVRKLQIAPGDLVVLTTPSKLTPEQRDALSRAWEAARLLPGTRLLFLEAGMDIALLSPPPEAKP